MLGAFCNSIAWLVVIATAMGTLERLRPAHPAQRFLRSDFVTDLIYWLTPYFVYGPLAPKPLAAAAAGLADPIGIVDMQRRELLRRLRDVQRAQMAEPDHSDAGLLLEGIVLRLQADLRWLEACERNWSDRRKRG